METATHLIGTAAAVASTASFAPQAWKIIATRDVSGLSSRMYLLTVAAFALWLTYGWIKQDWALMVPNALCLALSGFIYIMLQLPPRSRDTVADLIGEPLSK
ncbi:MAG: SemiSWEET family transporter [Novosphingobium sp.]